MEQTLILDINISTAIYVAVYFQKYQKYPLIFCQERSNAYHPIIVSQDIHNFLCNMFPGMEVFFKSYNLDIGGKILDYKKYILLDGVRDFLIAYFGERGEIIYYDAFTFTHNTDTVMSITFFKEETEAHYENIKIISGGNGIFAIPVAEIVSYKKVELFIFDRDKYISDVSKIYEFGDTQLHTLFFTFSTQKQTYMGIEFLPGKRSEAIASSTSFFHKHIKDFKLTDLGENTGKAMDIKISLFKPEFKNVQLLGNGLGYLPIMYNFGLLFSIFDAVNSVHDSYLKVIYYRANLYKIFKTLFDKYGVVEGHMLIDNFFKDNKELHISYLESILIDSPLISY